MGLFSSITANCSGLLSSITTSCSGLISSVITGCSPALQWIIENPKVSLGLAAVSVCVGIGVTTICSTILTKPTVSGVLNALGATKVADRLKTICSMGCSLFVGKKGIDSGIKYNAMKSEVESSKKEKDQIATEKAKIASELLTEIKTNQAKDSSLRQNAHTLEKKNAEISKLQQQILDAKSTKQSVSPEEVPSAEGNEATFRMFTHTNIRPRRSAASNDTTVDAQRHNFHG